MTIYVVKRAGVEDPEIHFSVKTLSSKYRCSIQSIRNRIKEEESVRGVKKSKIFGNDRIFKLHSIPERGEVDPVAICENCPYAVQEGHHLCEKCEEEEEIVENFPPPSKEKKDESGEEEGEASQSEGDDSR